MDLSYGNEYIVKQFKRRVKISKFKTHTNRAPADGKVLIPSMEIEFLSNCIPFIRPHHRKCTYFSCLIFGRFFFLLLCAICSLWWKPSEAMNETKLTDDSVLYVSAMESISNTKCRGWLDIAFFYWVPPKRRIISLCFISHRMLIVPWILRSPSGPPNHNTKSLSSEGMFVCQSCEKCSFHFGISIGFCAVDSK